MPIITATLDIPSYFSHIDRIKIKGEFARIIDGMAYKLTEYRADSMPVFDIEELPSMLTVWVSIPDVHPHDVITSEWLDMADRSIDEFKRIYCAEDYTTVIVG